MTHYTPKLFVLEASGAGRLFSINPDGSDQTTLVTGCSVPDGVAVDVQAGHIYWTNMGKPPVNDGSIERVDLDGGNRTTDRSQRRHLHPQAATSRHRRSQAVLG
jgi:hypothetical protein